MEGETGFLVTPKFILNVQFLPYFEVFNNLHEQLRQI